MIPSVAKISVTAFGLSDVGRVRKNNEDNFLFTQLGSGLINAIPSEPVDSDCWLFIVADGMGGGQAGEVASQMTVDLVAKNFTERVSGKQIFDPNLFAKDLERAVDQTNQIVFDESQANRELRGMGTTLTAAAVNGSTITVAQLGDSRAYLLRDGRIRQLTKDQSLVAQMVAAGKITEAEAKTHPRRNVILKAVGVQSRVEVAIANADLKRDDCLVLCSDGLWGKVEPEEIQDYTTRFDPQAACENLVRLANERGGEDNVTVIIAAFSGDGLPLPGTDDAMNSAASKKLRRWWMFWR